MKDASQGGWLQRLKSGLKRSASALADGISGIFTKRRLDDAALEELEELLIGADLGIGVAGEVVEHLRRTRFDREVSGEEVKAALAEEIARRLRPVARPFVPDPALRPHVVLVVGVNGSGKTTTIGKFANDLKGQGLRVMLAAGDTFRAAAIEQLQVWGGRVGVPVIAGKAGADAAGLAFDALQQARAAGCDVLLIDTAGRLQNKSHLMAELEKIGRVLKKLDPGAPHSTLLVLDATTGQNALSQVEVFREVCQVSGLIMTKLDGTARGGILVALADRHGLPVHAIGVGEGIDDLRTFDPDEFARTLAGVAAH
ncbi:MAG: signal recognition particle-docking protein FtsY [Alphaproteobacteria bacterium]|nr:signal recognition particle-docking protein FtsY [Alphaproteobacteria bacterium]